MSTLSFVARGNRPQAQVAEIMRAVPGRSTEPEKVFRKALRHAGIRSFRICDESLPGKPDIVIPSRKLAIFIDGDFWHGNQYRTRGHATLDEQLNGINNEHYWRRKLGSNIARDLRNTSLLLRSGWRVARFWESEVRGDIGKCVKTVLEQNSSNRAAFSAIPGKTLAEFFSGIGLMRLALDSCGWTTLFANDNDPEKNAMYHANFGDQGLDSRSIHNLSADDIPTCTLATASFPCNDLSLAGARKGLAGTHSSAFWGFIRLLKEMRRRRPPLVLLENVPGFLTSHGGQDFAAAVGALNELGYACDPFIIDAAKFVPQSRSRLFIVAKHGTTRQKDDEVAASALRPQALVNFIKSHPYLSWDLRSLPDIQSAKVSLAEVIENIPDDDPRWWSRERAEYFFGQLSSRHEKIANFMISQKGISYGTAFRRIRNGRSMAELRVDGIAGCLRTPRGGSGRQILFRGGNGGYAVRLLTPRECARLQGVPDDRYKIEGKANRALFGFGDAVCVPVVQWIARNYLNPITAELIRGRVLTDG